MKTFHFFKIYILFLILGSLVYMGCRASVDIGHPRHSSIQRTQTDSV